MSDASGQEVSPHRVDARGLACPIPIALLARALKEHVRVELLADDPAARGDVEVFCQQLGLALVSMKVDGVVLTAVVQRPGLQPE